MRIVGAASAFPQHYYSQEMLLEALQEYWGDQIENPHVLRRLHRHVERRRALPLASQRRISEDENLGRGQPSLDSHRQRVGGESGDRRAGGTRACTAGIWARSFLFP